MAFQLRGLGGAWDDLWTAAKAEQSKQSIEDMIRRGESLNITYLLPDAPNVNTGAPTSTPGGTAQGAVTQQLPTPSTVVTTANTSSKPWYKTWWGIGLIAAGAYGGYRAFKK